MMSPLLELTGVTRRFGGLVALNGLNMSVKAGAIHGLIGPNGAGKSTAFDLISGLRNVSHGTIRFDGDDISSLSVEARVATGICRTFQTSRLFEAMTALETVMVGCHRHGRTGFIGSVIFLRNKMREERDIMERARHLLQLVGMEDDATTQVAHLSYGRRRLLEIARALATGPRLLLLDEVASGLNPVETRFVADLIRTLAHDGMTVVLVEHDMHFIMNICRTITVLNFGSLIANGPPGEIVENDAVIEAYLGRPGRSAVSRRDARAAYQRTKP